MQACAYCSDIQAKAAITYVTPLTPSMIAHAGDCGIDPTPVVRETTRVCYGTSIVSASFSFKANKAASNISFVQEPNPAKYAGLACRQTSGE